MKNKYKICDNYIIIYCKSRREKKTFEVLIDLEDLEKVNQFGYTIYCHWIKHNQQYYPSITKYSGKDKNNKYKYQHYLLHELVLDFPDKPIDHIDGNTFDNRKINLRITDDSNNSKNRKSKNKNNISGYRNVSWIEKDKVWRVQLQINGKNTRLGDFKDVNEAGKFAEDMRQKYYGEFAGKN